MQKIIHFLLAIGPITLPAQTWQVSSQAPMLEPVSNNAVCEGFIEETAFVYSFAGIDSTKLYSGIHNHCYRLNTATNEWMQIADLPDPLGKIAAAASRIGDTIYIGGGYHVMSNGNEISSNKLHRYRISTNTFMPDAADIPLPIDDQVQSVWRDSLIYLITGWSNNRNVPDVQIYNPTNNSWAMGTAVPDNNLYKAFGASGCIIGDTIYYYGGASQATNFPALKLLRKGAINPEDPTQISWSFSIPNSNESGYRTACTIANNQISWIGGSATSYNYNGIAYNGTGGVPPLQRSFWYNPNDGGTIVDTQNLFPMDLRGVANINDTIKYIVGGMVADQTVSGQVYKLEYLSNVTSTKNPVTTNDLIKLIPNPASGQVTIVLQDSNSPYTIELYDLQGRLVLDIANDNKINVSGLPEGTYMLILKQERNVFTSTLIVQ